MTAHWIGSELECTSAVLHTQKMEESLTGVAIFRALESMLETWANKLFAACIKWSFTELVYPVVMCVF